jgi:hypothetical protein
LFYFTCQQFIIFWSAVFALVIGFGPLGALWVLNTKHVPAEAKTYFEKNPVNHWLRGIDRRLQTCNNIGNRAPYITESIDWLLHALPFCLSWAVLHIAPATSGSFEHYRSLSSSLLVGILILISGYYWGVADVRFNRLRRSAPTIQG